MATSGRMPAYVITTFFYLIGREVGLVFVEAACTKHFAIVLRKRSMAGQHEEFDPIVRGASLILAFQLKGKRVVIVGGGQVAAGRLSAVLAADAIVTLISPSSGLSPEVRHRIFVEKVVDRYEDRVFGGEEDLEGADMCLTAIDEVGLSSKIYEMCKRRRIIVNVADVPPEVSQGSWKDRLLPFVTLAESHLRSVRYLFRFGHQTGSAPGHGVHGRQRPADREPHPETDRGVDTPQRGRSDRERREAEDGTEEEGAGEGPGDREEADGLDDKGL